MFFWSVYPLLDADIKVDLPRAESAATQQYSVGEKFDIVDYFVLTEDSFLRPFTIIEIKTEIQQIKTAPVKTTLAIAENIPATMDYIVVTEKNLFHPERKMPLEKKAEQEITRPEIIFFGAIITDDKKIAYIEDKKNPYTTPGRGKRQTPVVQGAMIGGYKLTEVNTEMIVLVRGDDKMVVSLRDQKDRKNAETTKGQKPSAAASKTQTPSGSPIPVNQRMPPGQPMPVMSPSSVKQPFVPAPPSPRGPGPALPTSTGR